MSDESSLERAWDVPAKPGDRIANEVTWADQLGVSRPTMRQAIQLLVDKGMLVRKRDTADERKVRSVVITDAIRESVRLIAERSGK